MNVASLVPERPDDLERMGDVKDVFTFTRPEPLWNPLVDERLRALVRLLAFVVLVGIGAGAALWVLGLLVAGAIRGFLS